MGDRKGQRMKEGGGQRLREADRGQRLQGAEAGGRGRGIGSVETEYLNN